MEILKFIFILTSIISFGFISLSQLARVSSLILLIPFSFLFGNASFIALEHILAYIVGPQIASIATICSLFVSSILILIFKSRKLTPVHIEIKPVQYGIIFLISLLIGFFTFLVALRFGVNDTQARYAIVLSLYHNNTYPPKDFYRPDYYLIYHFGGELLPGAIHYICNFHIATCYALVSTILSITLFLTLFAIAWLITNHFKLSLLTGFCTYFGGGLIWLDTLIRYLSKNLPPYATNWDLLSFFTFFGLRGGIVDAASIVPFNIATAISYPLLIFSLFLFWLMVKDNNIKGKFFHFIFLTISLLALLLSAEWLYLTFLGGVVLFFIVLSMKKQKYSIILTLLLLVVSFGLNKAIGNPVLNDQTQYLGRANLCEVKIKDKLFETRSLKKLNVSLEESQMISYFSWESISEFGLSIILLPITIIYLIRTKNLFALLLFFSALSTMPIPTILELKIVPIDMNRFFGFGQVILVLLLTCGIGTLFKNFLQNWLLKIIYIILLSTSPLLGLLYFALSPKPLYSVPSLTQGIYKSIKEKDIKKLGEFIDYLKDRQFGKYKTEIEFLKKNSKPNDVAISSHLEAPVYAGVYTIIPPGTSLYKDVVFPKVDNIYQTIFSTLDPYLLHEFNVKWIILDNNFKSNLSKDIQEKLNDSQLFMLEYKSVPPSEDETSEIYHVSNLNALLKNLPRKTAWVLVNMSGQPIEITYLRSNKISLFPSSKEAILYLKSLHSSHPELKKELIMTRVVPIEVVEKQLNETNSNIVLEKRFKI
ncbi:MAG: hypothetical protein HY094_09490 [Candidatus Melainabacteria bacterium]|nr:hypothetical protein [Candidatus Melainabacteria bacterium]